jgi:tetratricopeptide (TPR) repeat protein
MTYQISCSCGKVLSVEAGSAGSVTLCSCGKNVKVPSLTELKVQAVAHAETTLQRPTPEVAPADEAIRDIDLGFRAPLAVCAEPKPYDEAITSAWPLSSEPSKSSESWPHEESIPASGQVEEMIAPVEASLRAEPQSRGGRRVMAALTHEAVWIQDAWLIRSLPLGCLGAEQGRNDKELLLTIGPEADAEKITLTFTAAAAGERWVGEIRRQQKLLPTTPQTIFSQPEGVSLVRRAGNIPHKVVGQLDFTSQNSWSAGRGLQLRAGMRGADAVINVYRHKCPDLGWGACQMTGTLIRLEDADARKRMRLRFYAEQVSSLVKDMLLLLSVQAVILFLFAVFCISPASLQVPTGQKLADALASTGLGLGMFVAWPFVLLVLVGTVRWPGLLTATGLAVLAATTGRVLMVLVSHIIAVRSIGAALGKTEIAIIADPVNWALIIFGVKLFLRARSLAGDARQILPDEMQTLPTARVVWTRGLSAASAVYGLALLGFVGVTRYEDSVYLLQPGVDVRREQEALSAMNDGVDQFDQGNLAAAERSWQRSLQLWEELTRAPGTPVAYQADLAQTLYNLGLVCERLKRQDDADKYYERIVTLAPRLEGDPQVMTPQFRQTLTYARHRAFARREQEGLQALDEGLNHFNKGELAAAEASWRRSLQVWEELTKIPSAPAKFRGDLAQTLYNLGFVCERGSRFEEAVKYYERIVNLAPQLEENPQLLTPAVRQTLDDARQALAELRRRKMNMR